jgi:hypothetical protein
VPAHHWRPSIVGGGNAPWLGAGQYFVKIFEPAAALAPHIKADMAGANRLTRSGKKLLRDSGRCCAPRPPCTDLIVPPGHPLPGRASLRVMTHAFTAPSTASRWSATKPPREARPRQASYSRTSHEHVIARPSQIVVKARRSSPRAQPRPLPPRPPSPEVGHFFVNNHGLLVSATASRMRILLTVAIRPREIGRRPGLDTGVCAN